MKSINIITGIVLLIINVLWVSFHSYFLCCYLISPYLWYFMIPYSILIWNILVGLICIILAILLIKNKISLKKCLIINITILLIGILMHFQ